MAGTYSEENSSQPLYNLSYLTDRSPICQDGASGCRCGHAYCRSGGNVLHSGAKMEGGLPQPVPCWLPSKAGTRGGYQPAGWSDTL